MPRTGDMENRCQRILDILEREGATSVTDLATALGVTKETIRKDLQLLADQEKIARIHGGAALSSAVPSIPFEERENLDTKEKRLVAAAACDLIEAGDSVLIEGSTTNSMLCEALLENEERLRTLTVVTNSIRIVQTLGGGAKCRMLFFLGGQMDPQEGRACGKLTVSAMQTFHVNKAFISAAALDRQMRITSFREDDMLFQQQAIACADKTYVLINRSKFPSSGLFSVCSVYDVSGLVSDMPFDSSVIEQLEKNQVQWVQA